MDDEGINVMILLVVTLVTGAFAMMVTFVMGLIDAQNQHEEELRRIRGGR